jgi:hypothetical protein
MRFVLFSTTKDDICLTLDGNLEMAGTLQANPCLQEIHTTLSRQSFVLPTVAGSFGRHSLLQTPTLPSCITRTNLLACFARSFAHGLLHATEVLQTCNPNLPYVAPVFQEPRCRAPTPTSPTFNLNPGCMWHVASHLPCRCCVVRGNETFQNLSSERSEPPACMRMFLE